MSFIGLLSSAILFLLFGVALIYFSISTNKKWQKLKGRREKNKKKQKRLQRIRRELQQKKKKQSRIAILFITLFLVTASGAVYARYYQLTNLTAEDADAVAKAYYLVGEMEKQIKSVENGASPEKTVKNLRNLSAQLASASVKTASQGMSVEGQKLLNRHLSLTRNLAVNISNQNQEALANPTIRETYLKDIDKVTTSEQKVFKHFKVNESALQQKK